MENHSAETLETEAMPVKVINSAETLVAEPSSIAAENSADTTKSEEILCKDAESSPIAAENSADSTKSEELLCQDAESPPIAAENSADSTKSEELLCKEEDEISCSQNRSNFSYSRSHWSQSWGTITNAKPLNSHWDNPEPNDEPSPFDWSDEPSESKFGANSSVSAWSPWNFHEEEEAKSSMLGAGLSNLGNTCFMNAVLQSFMHTVPLIQGLKSNNHVTPCDGYLKGFCSICALRELIDASLFSEAGVISPWKFVNNLSYFSSTFHRFQQEDAHEFLQCFLDKLERCCDDSRPKDTPPSEMDNIVKQAFGGRLVSKLRCCNCGHCSDTYETLIDLSLEIEDVESLDTALESFTKVEKIEDSEIKFTCEKCKEQVSIEKQLVLDKVPSVAALHLKRFKTDGSFVEKIDKYVSFPLELDLHAYADNNQINEGEMKYDLYAVIVHTGISYSSGHYYSFIRSAPNEWYKFDDSRVFRVREAFVLSQEAYVLFYAKRGTPWFSDFIETQKPLIDLSLRNTSPKSVLVNADAISITSLRLPNTHASCGKESNAAVDESSPNYLKKFQGNEVKENVKVFSTPAVDKHVKMISTPAAEKNAKVISTPSLDKNAKVVSTPTADKNAKEISTPAAADKLPLPSVLRENSSTLNPGSTSKISKNVYITPKTPSRSPSPEIYREEPADDRFYIPRGHLRSAGQVSCKKQLQKELEQDEERKQACSLIKKNMQGSRQQQLLAALRGSRSEGSVNKKRRRIQV